MRTAGFVEKAVTGVDETVAESIDVGIVDLCRNADEDELGTACHTSYDGLGLQGCELLRFIKRLRVAQTWVCLSSSSIWS